ncbi:MAG: preprotein translocase subunit SecA, partial [Bacteroidales bacterium]|nr:preprotein translocase subunit SecA [Bacteroidales bacterium]
MSLINNVLTKFFGNKSLRDIKEVTPVLEKIKLVYENIVVLSNDDLRLKSDEVKSEIKNYIKEETEKIKTLKDKAESDDVDIFEKENIYDEIDKIEKIVDEKLEVKLNEVLPIVFSIVKETARRFKENEIV